MKYDKIAILNIEKGKRNLEIVKHQIQEMIYRKERVTVTALAKYTKLDRSYFYKNSEAKKLVDAARLKQGECYNPKKIIADKASEEVISTLKVQLENSKINEKKLLWEIIQLKQRIEELEKNKV